jgi:hypothetical protein
MILLLEVQSILLLEAQSILLLEAQSILLLEVQGFIAEVKKIKLSSNIDMFPETIKAQASTFLR